ncbi:MAG: hypothetical protein HY062_15865 [Bacteroidetes bacterium]|nr:hypothetical protein [Bacteroidota bacterium]
MTKSGSILKGLIVISFLCNYYLGKSQALVGIQSQTVFVVPGYTVTNGTSILVGGSFKNTGSVPLTGTITVNLAIDTSSFATPKYSILTSTNLVVSNFSQGSSQSFTIGTTASGANNFKVNGNGTTVVVWPVIGTNNQTTSDSAFTKVTVISPTKVRELQNTDDIFIANPINTNVSLTYDESIYKSPDIFDLNGKEIPNIIIDKTIYCEKLAKGIYYVKFYNIKTDTYLIRKIVVH